LNRLFVANKPPKISSNHFLSKLKTKYGVKSAGYSGTLDPFAQGTLIVAFGKYSKLFRFFKKEPKTYKATILLGTTSKSLDTQNILSIEEVPLLDEGKIKKCVQKLVGKKDQIPPSFSAKRLNGKRAYELATKGIEFELVPKKIEVFDAKFLSYKHPYLSFSVSVSEGTYVRVLAQDLVNFLSTKGTLSFLERTSEGEFFYENERPLDPIKYLNMEQNFYLGDKKLHHAPKLNLQDLKIQKDGIYYIKDSELRIMQISDGEVKYLINSIEIG